jgi:hypothetical protein
LTPEDDLLGTAQRRREAMHVNVNLTIEDLIILANTSKLDKGDLTLAIQRPILARITADPKGTKSEVLFFLDEV